MSLGQSSSSLQSARTTCAATPTRTTYRCGARSRLSDSASAAPSRWPTERSASPTTGSGTPRLAQQHPKLTSLITCPTISHVILQHPTLERPQKPQNINVAISNVEGASMELRARFSRLHPLWSIAPHQQQALSRMRFIGGIDTTTKPHSPHRHSSQSGVTPLRRVLHHLGASAMLPNWCNAP